MCIIRYGVVLVSSLTDPDSPVRNSNALTSARRQEVRTFDYSYASAGFN